MATSNLTRIVTKLLQDDIQFLDLDNVDFRECLKAEWIDSNFKVHDIYDILSLDAQEVLAEIYYLTENSLPAVFAQFVTESCQITNRSNFLCNSYYEDFMCELSALFEKQKDLLNNPVADSIAYQYPSINDLESSVFYGTN